MHLPIPPFFSLQNLTPSKRAAARHAADSPPLAQKKRNKDDYASSVRFYA